MDLKEIVSVSRMSGLHKVMAQRQDGLIIQELGGDKSKFVSNRSYVFTPLDGITIYTENDSAELSTVLWEMKQQVKTNPIPEKNTDDKVLKEYFSKILTDYDRERVYVSDIKKVLKWYAILDEHGLITEPVEEKEAEKEAEKVEEKAEAKKETKKKPKKAAKAETEAAPEKETKPAKKAAKPKAKAKAADDKPAAKKAVAKKPAAKKPAAKKDKK